jgi:hypothetical protein
MAIQKRNQAIKRQSNNQLNTIIDTISQLPKFSHRQSIEAVMKAIEVETSNRSQAEKNIAAKVALAVVSNSDSLELAEKASQNLNLLHLLQQAQRG